jgi:hypothetical protein
MAEEEPVRGSSGRLATGFYQPYAALLEQAASPWRSGHHPAIQAQVTDVPGQPARIIQPLHYRMKLPIR